MMWMHSLLKFLSQNFYSVWNNTGMLFLILIVIPFSFVVFIFTKNFVKGNNEMSLAYKKLFAFTYEKIVSTKLWPSFSGNVVKFSTGIFVNKHDV
jgi:cell shape-determining protein MreD